MLEFFRRHRGAFLITLTVIIIISFSFWGGWKSGNEVQMRSPTDPAFYMYGKKYTLRDVDKMERMQMIAGQMLRMFEFIGGISQAAQDPQTRGMDFPFNLVVLQHEMEALGIHPSDAEAKAELEALPGLQKDGKFDPQMAHNMEQMLGMYGMRRAEMLDLARYSIGLRKLKELIGKNYQPSPLEAEKSYASRNQTLKIQTVAFNLEDFKKTAAAEVKDEDIQKYYDENKDNYKTEEKRAISYLFFESPKAPEKKPEDDKKKEEEKKDADKKDADPKKAEEEAKKKADEEKKKAEDEQKAQEELDKKKKELADRVAAFSKAAGREGATLETISAEFNKEKDKPAVPAIQTLPAFTQAAPPEAIKADSELVTAVFSFIKGSRPYSYPVKTAKGWYFFSLTGVEESKPEELAAVKDKIKTTLTEQKGKEAMSKAVNDARTALQEGLKAGKKIEDLAKEKNLTLSPVKDLTISNPPADLPNAFEIARATEFSAPGEVANAVDTDTGALLVYITAKELRKQDNSADMRKSIADRSASQTRDILFNAWFTRKRQEARTELVAGPAGPPQS